MLLLVPAPLVERTEREYADLDPPSPAPYTIWSYARLSHPDHRHDLAALAPRLIVADEAHKLRNSRSTRTRRIHEYLRSDPTVGFVALSGTMTARSIEDYTHLADWALRTKSPIPRSYVVRQSWCAVIDVGGTPTQRDYSIVRDSLYRLHDRSPIHPSCTPREALQRRLRSWPGVVLTDSHGCDATLIVNGISLNPPKRIRSLLSQLERTWALPGIEYDSPAHIAEARRCLVCGFYYVWKWGPKGPDFRWLEARSQWGKAVRSALKKRSLSDLDSPGLLLRACEAGDPPTEGLRIAWQSWRTERSKPAPPVAPVWVSEYLLDRVISLANARPMLVWTRTRAFRAALSSRLPIADLGIAPTDTSHSIGVAIRSHGTGHNLQMWDHSLVCEPIPSGSVWEQLIGRTHRPGQQSDNVWCEYISNDISKNDINRAIKDCEYTQSTTGATQLLLRSTRTANAVR